MKVGQQIKILWLTAIIDTASKLENGSFACIAHILHADTHFFAIFGENGEIIL